MPKKFFARSAKKVEPQAPPAPEAAKAKAISGVGVSITPEELNRSAWTADGQPAIAEDGKTTMYTTQGRVLSPGTTGEPMYCYKVEFNDPSKNVYHITQNRNRMIVDPAPPSLDVPAFAGRQPLTVACSARQFNEYLQYLRTNQRNYLIQLRSQLSSGR